ncbi:IS110 family transposase [Acidovorax sp.]|uniref:IS110 family transposase n=1 Tax=Acidovorax sp. TaxID=1872122 RepID=UPI00391FC702
MQASAVFIGVDVSKNELVIAQAGQPPCCVPNNTSKVRAWLRTVPAQAQIAMESTGRYHALLAHLCVQAGLKVYVLNARDVFFYARALGARAKTDSVDAAIIARYLAEHHAQLHPWQPGSALQQQLQGLLKRRAQLATHRSSLSQSFIGIEVPGNAMGKLKTAFEALLKVIDAQIKHLIDSDVQMAQCNKRLQTITGIGPQTGALLTVLLSRITFANADALVAYSGLDPRPNDSGAKRGRRRLSKKGPALLRRQMFLAGLSATSSKALKALYKAIRAKGLTTTEAIVILGRKLLRIAFAVWKSGQVFDPAKIGHQAG